MIDLDKLAKDEEAACIDKADLFDFYNNNWSRLVEAVRDSQLSAEDVEALEFAHQKLVDSAVVFLVQRRDQYQRAIGVLDRLLAAGKRGTE